MALQEAAKAAGAISVAIVNVEDSPAARNADICLALHAGEERSVAATKTFIVSCVAACGHRGALVGRPGASVRRGAPAGDAGRGCGPDVGRLHGFRQGCGLALCAGAWPVLSHRAGNGPEAEGDLRHPCRGLFGGGGDAWPVGVDGTGLSGSRLFARRCRARHDARGGGEDAAGGCGCAGGGRRRLALRPDAGIPCSTRLP